MAHKEKSDLPMEERYPRNIPIDVWDSWKLNWRTGDPEKMAKDLKLCRPIIDRGLKYGNVKKAANVKIITNWFAKRLQKEKEGGVNLISQTTGEEAVAND